MKRPEQIGGWSIYEVMEHDRSGVSRRDGFLEREELWARIHDLKQEKANNFSLSVAMTLNSAELLYNDMVNGDASALQYLPDAIMDLNLSARELATHLLEKNGTSTLTHAMLDDAIDQAAHLMPKTLANLGSKSSTLADLEKIRHALDDCPPDWGNCGVVE